VDEETGNVFMQGTQGILADFRPMEKSSAAFDDGKIRALTFRLGTASPLIDGTW